MSASTLFDDAAAVQARAMKTLNLPLAMASPFWLAYGAAATVSAGWLLMARMAGAPLTEASSSTRRRNPPQATIEPPTVSPPARADPDAPDVGIIAPLVIEASAQRSVAPPSEPQSEDADSVPIAPLTDLSDGQPGATARDVVDVAVAAGMTNEPASAAAEPGDDDLTVLVGVGPRTALALRARGVTRFAHLAAWTQADLAAFDAELNLKGHLKGRGVRDAWIEQARRLAAEA